MGKKDVEALEITIDELPTYLHTNHSAYMEVADGLYYLTDVNDQYWRAQDTNQFNEKGHYVDCSPLVPTIAEFLDLPFHEGKSIRDLAAEATFYASGDGKDMPVDFSASARGFRSSLLFCSYVVQEPRGVERMPRGLCYDALRTTLVAKCAATREEKEGIMAEECSHECSSCGVSGCGDRTAEAGPSTLAPNKRTNVKHVIGVVSGKGGVGKSLVTSLLASEMNKRGHKVAILDADITGPSIPKSFGVDSSLTADADGINPAKSASGIEVMSVNLMLPEGDMPVAWRGPVVTGAIKQFWQEVNWGDVDYMFVDMPPGTSDVFLTVFQSLPVDGIVTVSAPQELVAMIVGKAVNLAKSLEVPVVGLVENMAYFKCDECGKEHHIFGEPQGAAVAEKYDIPAVATLPMDPTFARLVDEGKVEAYEVEGALDGIIDQIVAASEAE